MKIAVTYGKDHTLKPLDEAEIIGIIDKEHGTISEKVNPGYMMSKEMSMHYILGLNVDAIAIRNGFLCPGSYAMSVGKLKYIVTDKENVDSLADALNDSKQLDELGEELYQE
ncbi:MAG: hypothetical protein JRN26_01080 [Nitrososphaerota archaeon]|jgi:hypothetical protein|nr:hypothetical protein [Nitrososphaerota archaeon]MDG6929817.1 hypothetical protein [Nitrososphaerota archaeon]MDG6932684.1 hypothetical protein [Nitrososphaerota archaeon]MDG6935473.1 hypothetical protein [Nitrososphaerota archaeon]MDG6944136.1 hypothetical protein [Nitrososphaerota archaeon]